MTEIAGNCKCGDILYEAGSAKSVVNCHCNMCRQMNGGAFSTYVVVPLSELRVIDSKHKLSKYPVTDGATKHFCSGCGTPMYNVNPNRYPGLAMLYLGTVQQPTAFLPTANICCESKLSWVDSLPDIKNISGAPTPKA